MRTLPSPRTRPRKVLASSAVLAVAATVLVSGTPVSARPAAAKPAETVPASLTAVTAPAVPPGVPAAYAKQKLAWTKCFTEPMEGLPPGHERLECATMTAPLNWGKATARQHIQIAVSRLRPATGTPRGTLFTNPGGPGGPGLMLPLVLNQRTAVADAYEIVGFDVRGTGESTNVTCGNMSPSFNDPRDRSKTNINLMWAATDVYVGHCAYRSGALLKYVTTDQTVRDLDLLRHVLGWHKISWVGYSGGTWMGAYYATLFPKRVDRFVLDSNTEFTASWQQSFSWQPLGFERRFRVDFAGWAARYDDRFHLGRSAEAVRRFYEKLRADLKRNPVMDIDGITLDFVIASSMYGKSDFQPLAELLGFLRTALDAPAGAAAAQLSGRAEALARTAREARPGALPVAADAFGTTFYAITCQDTAWTRGRAYWTAESARQGRKYPLIGWSLLGHPCAVWPRPNIKLPKPTGRGVPPVLMVQSVHDAATPYEGAVRAHRAFAGSRLLTVTNEGDHGVYTMGNECVDALVDKYLLTGVLPTRDVQCAGTGIPAPVDPPQDDERRPAESVQNPLRLNELYTEAVADQLR